MTPAIRLLKSKKINFNLYTYECNVTHDFGHHCAEELHRDMSEVYKKNVEMVEPKIAEKITGYIVGGISPIGQKKLVKTLIDDEALKHNEILVSGGKRGLSVGINPQELASLLNATIGPVTDLHE